MGNSVAARESGDVYQAAVEYEPYRAMTEEELLAKLELSRKHAREGRYRDADDVISDMRKKIKGSSLSSTPY